MKLYYMFVDSPSVLEYAIEKAKEEGAVFFGDAISDSMLPYETSLLGNGMNTEYRIRVDPITTTEAQKIQNSTDALDSE